MSKHPAYSSFRNGLLFLLAGALIEAGDEVTMQQIVGLEGNTGEQGPPPPPPPTIAL